MNKLINKDLIIIGGGPGGLSAGIEAKKLGLANTLIIERNDHLGGILNQCIHSGFGLHIFKEELTGPEYAFRLIEEAKQLNVDFLLNSMVLNITKDKVVTVLNQEGITKYKAKTIILAMGCRERPRGAINIPGDRSSGIFTAGTAQEMMNLKGYSVGKKAVILGSGDIGLIMARRLVLENIEVECVLEIMPYSSGLKRNIAQCLEDYNIPLYYNSTITEIFGKERVEGIKYALVDENKNPILETEKTIFCDTVLFSVGLIPENDIVNNLNIKMSSLTGGAIVDSNYETNVDGIFASGNVLHVHDLVDNVSFESFSAAKGVYNYLNKLEKEKNLLEVKTGNGIRYAIPFFIDLNQNTEDFEIKFRTDNIYKNKRISIYSDENKIFTRKKKVVTPGEMEVVKILKDDLKGKTILIEIEE